MKHLESIYAARYSRTLVAVAELIENELKSQLGGHHADKMVLKRYFWAVMS